jgi:hypothetical protein
MLQLVVSRSHALLQLAIVPNVQLLRAREQRPELRTLLDKNFEGSKRDFYRSTGSGQMFWCESCDSCLALLAYMVME